MKLWELEDRAKEIRANIEYLNRENKLTIRELLYLGVNSIRDNSFIYLGCEKNDFSKKQLDLIVNGYLDEDTDGYTTFVLDKNSCFDILERN